LGETEGGLIMKSRETVIEKIKALLNKTTSNGCTEAEELAALAMARAWIDTHEINDDELNLSRDERAILHDEGEEDARDSHRIKWHLCRGISQFCNVRIFRDSSKAGLSVVGLKSDVDFALWLLDHLADFVHQALFEFLTECLAPEGKERKLEIRGFVIGCCERISDRMIELCNQSENARTESGKALIVIKTQAIDDYLKANNIELQSGRSRANFSDAGRIAGRNAGDRASFGRPVSGSAGVLRIGGGK
jgi:Protein of unknown function (DUF2786)